MDSTLLVLTTMPDEAGAVLIARSLVEEGLCACVNLLPPVRSIYWWQGSLQETNEVVLLIKTSSERYPALEAKITTLHPYELPEIIAVPIVAGLPAYLEWVVTEMERGKDA